jgi:hypothetical protein
MSKSSTEETLELTHSEDSADYSDLDLDQQLAIICASLEAVCNGLEQRGVDSDMLNAVLLETFASRMADVNDRQGYEQMLEQALSTEWIDTTIH